MTQLGCEIVGTVSTVMDAVRAAETLELDTAILDINLGGSSSCPVGEVLMRRGVPFIIASGYSVKGLPEELRNAPKIQNPYDSVGLENAVQSALGQNRKSVADY